MARYNYTGKPEEEIKPWDQMEGEPRDAFAAFVVYRDMGKNLRTIDKAYFLVYPERKAEGKRSFWGKWASKYDWLDRAEAYDSYIDSIAQEAARNAITVNSERLNLNRNAFKENEVYLADQGLRMVREILAQPLVSDEFIERKDKKTIIHRRSFLSPAHIVAAANLLKVSSEIGRRGLGIQADNTEEITPEQFRQAFYKTTGTIAKELPAGALPPPPPNPEAKPEFDVPGDGTAFSAAIGGSGGNAPGNNGNGSGGTNPGASVALVGGQVTIRGQRERPGQGTQTQGEQY